MFQRVIKGVYLPEIECDVKKADHSTVSLTGKPLLSYFSNSYQKFSFNISKIKKLVERSSIYLNPSALRFEPLSKPLIRSLDLEAPGRS
jgi:hypothetical protein